MPSSDDEDALNAQREQLVDRQGTGQLFRRPLSPKRFQSSQPFGSSSPTPLGNPFLLDDDIEEDVQQSNGDDTTADHIFAHIVTEPVAYIGTVQARSSSGHSVRIGKRKRTSGTTVFQPEVDLVHESKTKHYGIAIHTLLDSAQAELAQAQQGVGEPEARTLTTPIAQTGMWVDKYRPTKFTELLGDERTNRDVMRWIRHWDYCVFGRAVKKRPNTQAVVNGQDHFSAEVVADPHNRPQRRILMLTGPPGFGKTTLAHIAARQAGYNVIEVNASDDRTGSVVQNKIGDALESQAVFNPRPSLVIIDEIDGVSTAGGEAGFIKALLKFVVDDERAAALHKVARPGEQGKRKGKKRTNKALLRPIICICNDQYVAALRPLRQYCQIINFRPLSVPTVVARLFKICQREGLQADARALNALCEIAENDLRSCVNSLQYVRMKSTTFTLDSVANTLAKKDMSRSSHSVVEAVFKLLDAKKERKKGSTSISSTKDNIGRIADLAMTNNEYSKILNACFAHYPIAPYHDNLFSKPVEASDWLFFYDRCERGVYEQQHGELTAYMPYPVAAFHHLFATHESQRTLERSKADWEAREKTRISTEVLAGWVNGVKSSLRQIFTPCTFATELLSYGIRIIGPNLNPANAHLVRASDRAALARVVDAMLSMGLHYTQYRVDDGTYIFRLEPPVAQVLNFEGVLELKGESLLPSRYIARQLISAELGAEKIRRSLDAQGLDNSTTNKAKAAEEAMKQAQKRKAIEELAPQPAIKRDFFGRAIDTTRDDASVVKGASRVPAKPKAGVHIKFSDGFSDAVRNNISVKEILQR